MAAQPVPKVMKQGKLAPWLYLAPSLVIMTIFIVYPMINTIGLSFLNKDGTASAATTCVAGKACWGIFENYHYALTSELDTSSFGSLWSTFWQSSYGNTLKWIIFMVLGSVGIGLAFAVLSDRVKYEALAKAVIFMPMAISFVGAGVIWKFVYDFGTKQVQIGLLNSILVSVGSKTYRFYPDAGHQFSGVDHSGHLDLDRVLYDHPFSSHQISSHRDPGGGPGGWRYRVDHLLADYGADH